MDPEVAHNIAIGSLKHTGNSPLNCFYAQDIALKTRRVYGNNLS